MHQGESGSGSQPQHHEESGSEFELDSCSPPRITIMTEPEDVPGSPTSPPRYGSPPLMDAAATFGSDTEERYFSEDEDPYFQSLADSFTAAAEGVRKPTLLDNIDYKVYHQRKSNLYAKSALMHYNADENNKVKYELISVTASCGIVGDGDCYGHVNFTAKGNQENSKEELFFAELLREDYLTFVPTCVLSLEEGKSVGGLCGTRYDDNFSEKGLPMDAQHCYACAPRLKHPKNGTLYKSGHFACSDFYYE